MPGFDTTDAKSFLGASFHALSMTRGMSGSGAVGGLQGAASMSRAKSLNLARARSGKASGGLGSATSGRLGTVSGPSSLAGPSCAPVRLMRRVGSEPSRRLRAHPQIPAGTPFEIPKTLEEATAAATGVLGCVEGGAAAERFIKALTSEVGEGPLSAKLDAMIKQAEVRRTACGETASSAYAPAPTPQHISGRALALCGPRAAGRGQGLRGRGQGLGGAGGQGRGPQPAGEEPPQGAEACQEEGRRGGGPGRGRRGGRGRRWGVRARQHRGEARVLRRAAAGPPRCACAARAPLPHPHTCPHTQTRAAGAPGGPGGGH